MLHYRARLCLLADLDRDDAMIELDRGCPFFAHIIPIAQIDRHWISGDTNRLEHGAHQVRFILGVAVRLGKDLRGGMGSDTASVSQANVDGNILEILNIPPDGPNPIDLSPDI